MRTVFALLTAVTLLLVFSTVCLGSPTCADDDEACWIKVLKKGKTVEAMKAAMMLGNLQSEKAVAPLIKKLSHKDKYMATTATYALAKIGPAAIPSLVESTKSKKAQVRKYSAHALGQIGGDQVYFALSDLTRDPDPAVRKRALQALNILKEKRAAKDAILALKDQYRDIRIESVRLLGAIKDPRTIGHLVKYGMIDLSPEVSMETAAVLITFGPESVDALVENYPTQDPFVKTRFLYVLGEIARKHKDDKGEAAKKLILRVISDSTESTIAKQAAVSKLGDLGDASVIPALNDLLKISQDKETNAELVSVIVRTIEKLNQK